MRLLATGDLHIGRGANLLPNGERIRDQRKVLDLIVGIAFERNVDVVLVAGDVFDQPRPTAGDYILARRFFGASDVPVVAITGNAGHDVESGDRPCPLDVLDDLGHLVDVYRRDGTWFGDGYTIACLPSVPVARLVASTGNTDARDVNQLAAEYLVETAARMREDAGSPSVLLAHWSISGAFTPSGVDVASLREPVLPLEELRGLGYDAIVAGHIHKPQLMSDYPFALYVGSPMPFDHGEANCDHGVWIIDIDDDGARAEFVPIESRPFVTIDVDPDATVLTPVALAGAIVRVRVNGTRDEVDRIDANTIRRLVTDAGAATVRVELNVTRERRARAEGVDETVEPLAGFDAYARDRQWHTDRAIAARDRASGILDEVTA